jgi:hypothetical protein
MGYGLIGFLMLSAFFHFLVASPAFFNRYKNGLLANHNYFRWTEYSLSSSIMIFLIAQLTGTTDAAALMTIFAVNAAMIMFGALQEKYEKPGTKKLLPFIFGSMVGIVPWFAVMLNTFQPGSTNNLRVVQHLRAQPVVAVPPGWQVGKLPSGRAFIHHAQLGCKDSSRMAGIQRRSCSGYHRESVVKKKMAPVSGPFLFLLEFFEPGG